MPEKAQVRRSLKPRQSSLKHPIAPAGAAKFSAAALRDVHLPISALHQASIEPITLP
jgi:hypothetical protein